MDFFAAALDFFNKNDTPPGAAAGKTAARADMKKPPEGRSDG